MTDAALTSPEWRCTAPSHTPETTQVPFRVWRKRLNPLPVPAMMLFASFFSPSGAGSIKSHLSCLAVQPKPPRLRNPLQRGSDLTYPFHPETHYESPSKQSRSSSWHLGSLFALAAAARGHTRLLTHPLCSSTGTYREALE